MNEEYKLTDDEFRQMLRLICDNDTVRVGHLKDIIIWLRDEGKDERYLDGDGLVLFAESLLGWIVDDILSRRIIS
mgnify:CR=1 FL=1